MKEQYDVTADRFSRITEWESPGFQATFSSTATRYDDYCEEEVGRLEAKGATARIEELDRPAGEGGRLIAVFAKYPTAKIKTA